MRYLKQIYYLLERKFFDRSFSPVVCWSMAFAFFSCYIFMRYVIRFRSISTLLWAHYMLLRASCFDVVSSRLYKVIEENIKKQILLGSVVNFDEISSVRFSDQEFSKYKKWGGLVLKAPRVSGDRVVEKGVLSLRFNKGFCLFRNFVDVDSVLKSYVIVLEPGWSGYADLDILYFTRFANYPIVVMATELRDYEFLKKLGTNLIPVSFGAGDWVNPHLFYPLKNEEKKYDAIMVAKWKLFKRHHILFRALRKIRSSSYKVALVGIQLPSHRKEAELLINAYGVGDKISLFGFLSQNEVNRILNQSKVNLMLSLQEGSNKILFEGFFAGVPGLALKNNVGIQKDYFTPQTGKLIDENDLSSELLYFKECWSEFNPRPWAEANIAPEITTAKLNKLLKEISDKRKEEWRQDLVPKCNTPWSNYYPDEKVGRGLPSLEEILIQYARTN